MVGATTTVAVATSGGSSSPQQTVAQAEQDALRAFGRGDNAVLCNYLSKQMLALYGGKSGCVVLMASANGFINALGGSRADKWAAARVATVDPSKVRVKGNTAVVPGAAVSLKSSKVKVAGQEIQTDVGDTTWTREGSRWVIAMPSDVPSDLPTDLFPGGTIPSDIFPSSLPSDFLNGDTASATSSAGDVPTDQSTASATSDVPTDQSTTSTTSDVPTDTSTS